MRDTRPLDPAESRAWRRYMEATTLLFGVLDRQMQRESGMTHGYFIILVRLSEAPDRTLRMSELADETYSSRSRLSHAVARLEEFGWVQREGVENDRRGQLAKLTERGLAALENAYPGHVATVRDYVISQLDAGQLDQLAGIGETLLKRIQAN